MATIDVTVTDGVTIAIVQEDTAAAAASAATAAAAAAAVEAAADGFDAVAAAATTAVNDAGAAQITAVNTAGAAQVAAVNNAGTTQLLTLESSVSSGALALSLAIHNQSEAVIIKQRLAALVRGASPAVALAARVVNSGWAMEVDILTTNAGGTFDPTKIQLISYDKGFDANLQRVVRARVISGTRAVRRASPNQAQLYTAVSGSVTTYRISLDQQMFARAKSNTPGTTVNSGFAPILRLEAGWYTVSATPAPVQDGVIVTNNSTEAYPVLAVRNFLPPWRLIGATGLFEVSGNSIEATEGRTFAAARCDITGVTSGVTRSQIVTAMAASTAYPRRTNAVPVFAASIDMAPFTQGERLTERWLIYPWIGDVVTDSATGTLANGDFANHEHICNKSGTFPKVFAVVNPATGNDTTGVASTVSEAAAAAAPFATDKGAVYAAWQLNQSAHGRNSQSGIEICFSNTTHVLKLRLSQFSAGSLATFDAAEVPVDGTWCVYRPVTGAGACILQRDTAEARSFPRRTVLRGFAALDTVSVTAGGPIFIDGGETTTGTYGQAIWIDNSPILEANGTASTGVGFYRCGLMYMTNTLHGGLGNNALGFGNERHGWMLWRDSNASLRGRIACAAFGGAALDVSAGCVLSETPAANTNVIIGRDNIVIAGLSATTNNTGAFPLRYGSERAMTGLGVINLVVEYWGAGGQGTWLLSGDGINLDTSNFFCDYVTLVGGRLNVGYEDTFTMADSGNPEEQRKKMLVLRRSALHEINTKVDAFQGVAARIHTWNVAFRVGWKYVRVLQASSDNSTASDTNQWFGEAAPATVTYIGPDARAQFVDWKANNRAPAVTGTGGGNYMPAAGSDLLGVIPANDEACSVDLFGTARAGAVGAIERAA